MEGPQTLLLVHSAVGDLDSWVSLEPSLFSSSSYVFRRLGLGRARGEATVLASEFLLPTGGGGLCMFFLGW